MRYRLLLILLWLPIMLLSAEAPKKVTLQVLGSGGPELTDKRASASYLVWVDDKARFLIDFGGGASLRFEESDAKIEDLDAVLLTHLHIDHTSDLPALIKGAFFSERKRDLPIYGPEGNDVMPATSGFLFRLFESGKGAWEYMGDFLDGRAAFALKPNDIPDTRSPLTLFSENNISVEAVSVHHGPIPAVAYRINVGERSISFSGDMNGSYHTLEKLAKGTDILVMHNAVPKGATGVAAQLHMTPKTIGEIAAAANPKTLILSHRMMRTIGKELETIAEIRKYYKGKIKFADDGNRFLAL